MFRSFFSFPRTWSRNRVFCASGPLQVGAVTPVEDSDFLDRSSLSGRLLFACGQFFADFLVVVDGFTRSEVFHLEKLPDFDFALFTWPVRRGNSFGPIDGFLP